MEEVFCVTFTTISRFIIGLDVTVIVIIVKSIDYFFNILGL